MVELFVNTITTFIRVQRDPIEWTSGQTWKAVGRLFENAYNVTIGVVDHKGKFFTFTDGNIDYFLYRIKKKRRKSSFQLGRIKCPLLEDKTMDVTSLINAIQNRILTKTYVLVDSDDLSYTFRSLSECTVDKFCRIHQKQFSLDIYMNIILDCFDIKVKIGEILYKYTDDVTTGVYCQCSATASLINNEEEYEYTYELKW